MLVVTSGGSMIFPGGANPQRGRGTPEYDFSGRPTALDPPMVTYVIEKVVPPWGLGPGKILDLPLRYHLLQSQSLSNYVILGDDTHA